MATPAGVRSPAPVGRAGGPDVQLASLGALVPVSRTGGQGRVYAPEDSHRLAATPLVVKLYRAAPPTAASRVLGEMVAWGRMLDTGERRTLYRLAAWPLATVSSQGALVGIVMQDLRPRFELPFRMPSGRVSPVMLQLEHLLGPDDYLRQRGLPLALDTRTRIAVAGRICAAFAYLHAREIVVGDVSPSNLLIAFGASGPRVTLIDCDSMLFRGHQALTAVETRDWQVLPAFGPARLTRASDAYKLGLLVLRLLARDSEARSLEGHTSHVPAAVRGPIARALSEDEAARPSAEEWVRTLHRVLADEHVGRRHPGPPPPLRRRARARTPAAPHEEMRLRVPPLREPQLRTPVAGRHGTGTGFTVVWLVAGLVALLLFMQALATLSNGGGSRSAVPPGAGESRFVVPEGRGYEPRTSEPAAPAEPGQSGEASPSR